MDNTGNLGSNYGACDVPINNFDANCSENSEHFDNGNDFDDDHEGKNFPEENDGRG